MKKLFLDTNIFIDILTKRKPNLLTNEQLISLVDNYNIYISALTVHITYYVTKIKPKSSEHEKMKRLLRYTSILPLDNNIVGLSTSNFCVDFEDTLQYFSALEGNCDYILTRNKRDFDKIKKTYESNIKIVSSFKEVI